MQQNHRPEEEESMLRSCCSSRILVQVIWRRACDPHHRDPSRAVRKRRTRRGKPGQKRGERGPDVLGDRKEQRWRKSYLFASGSRRGAITPLNERRLGRDWELRLGPGGGNSGSSSALWALLISLGAALLSLSELSRRIDPIRRRRVVLMSLCSHSLHFTGVFCPYVDILNFLCLRKDVPGDLRAVCLSIGAPLDL